LGEGKLPKIAVGLNLPKLKKDDANVSEGMSHFSERWEKRPTVGFGGRLRGGLANPGPIRPRLEEATRQIQIQISKLDATVRKLNSRDLAIFGSVVSSIHKHDSQRATIYANELSELRKISKMITQSKLVLEQTVLRLGTIREMGDVVMTLAPTVSAIRSIKEGLGSVLPEAESEMNEISSLLSGVLIDAGYVGGYALDFKVANEEDEKALDEAAQVAEQRIKEGFPEIPVEISTVEEPTEETAI
jgi:division protein CdvB (Snf7/Vps24/ESCRT-III family)